MIRNLFLLALTTITIHSFAQSTFPDRCVGHWEGRMVWWAQGLARDTVPVEMDIVPLDDTLGWSWKTVYITPNQSIVKDYRLFPDPEQEHAFLLDEGDGIVLASFVFGDRMYSSFEVSGNWIQSCYILDGDQLNLELTAGMKAEMTAEEIQNYSVGTLQWSELYRKQEP